jgi:ABC-2 type transport system permease protein
MSKWLQLNTLRHLIMALFREILREPGVLFWGILFPILMALGLGLAFSQKADITRKIAIINNEKPANGHGKSELNEFIEKYCEKNNNTDEGEWRWKYVTSNEQLGNSVFLFYAMNWDEGIVLLKRGTINVLLNGKSDSVEYHFDPLNTDAELTYLKLSNIIGKGEVLPVETNNTVIRPLTVTGTRYIDFLVPGLITMGVMMSSMWGISYGIIEKRSKKLLRRLVATPMKKSHFLIALITVRIIMNFIESSILLLFATLVFHLKIQGDISALILMFVAGNIAFAGLAVFVSSHTSNTEVGNGLINAVVFPMMILSGIFFSYQNFPEWSLPVIRNLPLTTLTDGIRSIFNEGAGYRQVTMPIIEMLATGVVFFTAGLKIFKWH